MKTTGKNKKTSYLKSSLALFVFVIISLFLFLFIIFSGPTPMKIYTNYLEKHTSAKASIETYNKDEFSQLYFHQNFQNKGFFKNFEEHFGTEGKKKGLFMRFYDIRDKVDSCVYVLYGISRYTDLIYVSRRRICETDTTTQINYPKTTNK